MNSSWAIRDGRTEDAPAVLDLWKKADATPSVSDQVGDIGRLLREPCAFLLLAEADAQVIGSAIGTFDGWRVNIYRLAVDPAFRRRGIARALIAETDRRLTERGAKRITALVEKNHPLSSKFWDGIDYKLDQRIVRYVHHL